MSAGLEPDSDELCERVSALQGGECLFAFSRGKDSLAAWLQLRKFFTKIYPYYIADFPGLQFVEDDLKLREEQFGTRITRLVSPYFFELVEKGAYLSPAQFEVRKTARFHRELYGSQLDNYMRRKHPSAGFYIAHGWRTADSFSRHMVMRRLGVLEESRGWFHCVHDWTNDRVEQELRAADIHLPVDYTLFGRSFESIQSRFLTPLREAYPADYERIVSVFPLAHLDEVRRTLR